VVGAGALGNEILKNLALVGAGHIVIADFDQVEKSNLSRSILFRPHDIGLPKAAAAARGIREINDEIQVVPLEVDIEHGLGLGVVRRVDLVLAGLDNVGGRIAVNRLCRNAGKPWLDGGLHELDGLVRFFHPDEGACYECGLSDRDYARESRRYSCQLLSQRAAADGVPTSPTGAATIAAWQVQEALKWIHGLPVLRSEMVSFYGQSFETRRILLTPRDGCVGHSAAVAEVRQLPLTAKASVGELMERLNADFGNGASVQLRFDVVTAFGCARCRERVPVNRALHALRPRDALCPVCGEERTANLTHRIGGGEKWTEPGQSLESLGIPPLEVLSVASASGERNYAELSGDAMNARWVNFFRHEFNAE